MKSLKKGTGRLCLILTLGLSFISLGSSLAQIANVWHLPTATQDGIPSTMRDPSTPTASQSVTFYQGLWKGDGANQNAGYLVYRINNGIWQSVNPPLYSFHSNVGVGVSQNQFWKASFTMPSLVGTKIDYYFITDFSNRSRTFIYSGNLTTLTESVAQANPYTFTIAPPKPTFLVNGVSGDYSKSNFYIDENNDSSFPSIQIRLTTNVGANGQVEIFTNLNNRDKADNDFNNDGIEDGILPPNGNNISVSDTNAYFRAYTMVDSNNDGTYELDLPVLKTGAYRITARYKSRPADPWTWLGSTGIRDHAVIVAPKIARDMRIYEIHVPNVNATSATFEGRGTFEDLHDPAERVNLSWLQNLGVNWIWFQPFHPQGLEGRQTDPTTGQVYDPGSPYSIRNFWEINPLYTRNYNGNLPDPVSNSSNYLAAMTAFQSFAQASDTASIQLMVDFPFNHTAPDVVLGQKGVEIFGGPWNSNDKIRDQVPGFFSTDGNEGFQAYSRPAQSGNRIAVAPDRNDFGKWSDVRDVYFGNYATLVTGNPSAEASRAIVRNEGDWMDFNGMNQTTIGVWKYFGEVLPYWLEKSGHRGYNSTASDGNNRDSLDSLGIDGLRKDFGQGLPPQAMEYIINRTHEVKWNFVFMTESLDGEQVTYRSSRHFAVLNENIVFPLQGARTTSDFRNIVESRRSAYGQSLVLLNNTSHDELPFADPWEALLRYGALSTMDGAPMIMYGQEIGAGQKVQESLPQGGYIWYEENFGKFIPNFKKWNSMSPQWLAYDNNAFGVGHLLPVYGAIGKARAESPALRSSNRWFLNPIGSVNPDPNIFAVAKYTTPNSPVSSQDVVLGFFNLDRNNTRANSFGITQNLATIVGIQNNRTYNAKNLAAYTGRNNEFNNRKNAWLWGSGFTGTQILNNGIYVSLNPVPSTEGAWATNPYEAQYLKLYDVTAPSGVVSNVSGENTFPYTLGSTTSFSWSSLPTEAGVTPSYEVRIWRNGVLSQTAVVNSPYITISNLNPNDIVKLEVIGVNPNEPNNKGSSSPNSQSQETLVLDPNGDKDNDGMTNAQENIAGTNPLDSSSILKASISINNGIPTISWNPVIGRTYRVEAKENLKDTVWTILNSNNISGTFTDNNLLGKRFYRVVVE